MHATCPTPLSRFQLIIQMTYSDEDTLGNIPTVQFRFMAHEIRCMSTRRLWDSATVDIIVPLT
jgi:hypothetical protein